MYGAAVFEVSHHIDVDVVKPSLRLADSVEVKQCLGRVLVCPVAGIDYRYRRYFRGISCTSFNWMPHHDQVCVVGYHLDGVFEALSFTDAGVSGIREADYPCTKSVGGCFEAQSRAGGGFEEDAGNDLVA